MDQTMAGSNALVCYATWKPFGGGWGVFARLRRRKHSCTVRSPHGIVGTFGLDYGNPDFVKYAEAYGARGHRVERSEDLIKTLEACFAEHAVHLIDLPIDYSENDRILNREIRELSRELRP